MILLFVIVLVAISGALLVLVKPYGAGARPLPPLLRAAGLFMSALGFLWLAQLTLPLPLAWTAAALSIGVLVFLVTRRERGRLMLFLVTLAFGSFTAHFSLALLDLIMSTTGPATDAQLLLAAWKRGLSDDFWGPLIALPSLLILAAIVGHFLGSKSWRINEPR